MKEKMSSARSQLNNHQVFRGRESLEEPLSQWSQWRQQQEQQQQVEISLLSKTQLNHVTRFFLRFVEMKS